MLFINQSSFKKNKKKIIENFSCYIARWDDITFGAHIQPYILD